MYLGEKVSQRYSQYGVERVGVFAGTETFGTHYWYRELCEDIIKFQKPEGYWEDAGSGAVNQDLKRTWQTSYALLTLARGSAPIDDAPPVRSYTVSSAK